MNVVETLDCFFAIDSSAASAGAYPEVFAKLRPRGRPKFPFGMRSAYEAIQRIAREATDDIDPTSSRRAPVANRESFARVLMQAAIAAAKSDQRLGETDLSHAVACIGSEQSGDDTSALVREEVLRPQMIEHMTRSSHSRADTVEIYAVSRLATDANNELSNHYLKMLAARLGLEQAMTDRIETAITGRQRP